MKKIIAYCAVIVLGLSAVSGFAAPNASGLEPTETIHIFTFNDFHGYIEPASSNPSTLGWATTLQKAVLADPDNSMVVSAGDNIGASRFASAIQNDSPTLQLLNDLAATPGINFRASAVGNHEFDKGWADLRDRVSSEMDGWTYLGANVVSKATGQAALDPYYVYTLGNGIRVGVVGAVTLQVPALVSPAGIADLDFTDPVAAVNTYADQLKADGLADVVVAVYHEGAPEGTIGATMTAAMQTSAAFASIVNDTSGSVDAIVTGHTHQTYAWTGGADQDPQGLDSHPGRPIIQTGNNGANIGQIDLTIDTATMTVVSATAANIPTRGATPDLTVGSMQTISDDLDAALAQAAILGQPVVGQVAADVTTSFTGGEWQSGVAGLTYQNTGQGKRDDRTNESAMGRLVADSYLDTARNNEVIGGADIGVVNPGGLRSEFYHNTDGLISYAAANTVLPFANNMWTIELTGAQFKQLLEEQWQTALTGSPSQPYLALGISSNVTYTVDSDWPTPTATACTIEDGCEWGDEAGHITSVFVNGQPLDPAKSYKIVTVSFLTSGGDNFRVMTQGTDSKDTGLLDRDAWIAYLLKESGMSAPGDAPASAITPDFARSSVVVSNLSPATAPMSATVVQAGSSVTAALSRLDLTSLGSPANTALRTYLRPLSAAAEAPSSGDLLATSTVTAPGDAEGCAAAGVPEDLNPASSGCARLDVTIPATTPAGDYLLASVAEPSGTTVTIWLTVTAAPTEPTEPAPTEPANPAQPANPQIPSGGAVSSTPLMPLVACWLLAAACLVARRYAAR